MSLAYDDAELLLSSILPDARISHLHSPSDSGSRVGIDIGVAVPRDTFDEALGVLREAGYVLRENDNANADADDRASDNRNDRPVLLAAPDAEVALTLHLVQSDARRESLAPLQAA